MKPDLVVMLDRAASYLSRPNRVLIDAFEAAELTDRVEDLASRIRTADDRLVIGLVGGTGVGKSTLINALAGRDISVSTELRPTTNRLLLYRHSENLFSLDENEEVRVHDSPDLKRISLADFPDFDSIEPHHQKALAEHFPRLDLLLWVVDPVKYADRAIYDRLAMAPQAKVNNLFIFNKIDEFKARYGDRSDEVTSQAASDFKEKLIEYGLLKDPEVLPLSAFEACENQEGRTSPGFVDLLARIEKLGRKKYRLAIKEMNVSAMTESLLSDIKQAAGPDQAETALERMKGAVEQASKDLTVLLESQARRMTAVLSGPWRRALSASAKEQAPWPLDFFLFIWGGILGVFSRRIEGNGETSGLPEPNLSALKNRLTILRSESEAVLKGRAPAQKEFEVRLSRAPKPEVTVETGGADLIALGVKSGENLAGKRRLRIKHHILPFLTAAYPFLPFFLVWLLALTSPESAQTAPKVELSLSWSDIQSLILAVIGLYLIQTIYFAYNLNRASSKALFSLVKTWKTDFLELMDTDQLRPIQLFINDLEEEIEETRALDELFPENAK